MQVRTVRILAAAVAIETVSAATIVGLIVVFGAGEVADAMLGAARLGIWLGPLAAMVLCLAGGYWVARGLQSDHASNGALLGAAVSVIDLAIMLVGGIAFTPLAAVLCIGRVVAGCAGGWFASPRC